MHEENMILSPEAVRLFMEMKFSIGFVTALIEVRRQLEEGAVITASDVEDVINEMLCEIHPKIKAQAAEASAFMERFKDSDPPLERFW